MNLTGPSYSNNVLFRTLKDEKVIPQKLFWIAVCTTFLVANTPPTSIFKVVLALLQVVPTKLTTILLIQDRDLQQLSNSIVTLVAIPIKKLLFFIALMLIGYPIVRCITQSKSFWFRLGLKRVAISALWLFLGLSLFIFPYHYPYEHPSGLTGMGVEFGRMSMAPFGQYDDQYYKRLLKPAIAHYIHLDGYVRYYLFSLICTYFLIFLTVAFLESKFLLDGGFDENQSQPLSPKVKWLVYLSLMTSSFILANFHRPGLSEHLSFILILLMASIPMTPQARLATVALCTVNHEGSALVLLPIILFCFPREERMAAIAVVALFYGMVLASYGFSATKGLQGEETISDKGSVWETALHNPGFYLAGLFFSYKLLWIPFVYAGWLLWNQKRKATLLAILAITLFPLSLTLLAWDTTRVGGFGWLGMLIAISILMQEYRRLQNVYRYAFLALIYANLLIPSYYIAIYYEDSVSRFLFPGIYMLIDAGTRRLLT